MDDLYKSAMRGGYLTFLRNHRRMLFSIYRSIKLVIAGLLFSLFLANVVTADDLLKSGKQVTNDTFGPGSFISYALLLGEVFMGMFLYVKTKNILMLLGFVILVVYLNVAFGVIG